jgi:hypothetical protein
LPKIDITPPPASHPPIKNIIPGQLPLVLLNGMIHNVFLSYPYF